MKGRKPIPTSIRILRGNPGKHPLNLHEPKPAPLSSLAPPEWLDEEAKAEWSRLAPRLARLGVITETDTSALTAYCEVWATWRAATLELHADGLVVETENGPRVSPHFKVANTALTQLRAFLVEFGMTPSARARIHTASPEKPASKWGGTI